MSNNYHQFQSGFANLDRMLSIIASDEDQERYGIGRDATKITGKIELMNHDDLKKNLHKIRSLLKELLFRLQIFKTKQLELSGFEYVTKDLASLGEYIGQWHDYELLINLYKKVNDQLHEPTTIEFKSILSKSDELFEYVSKRLYLQFSLI